MFLTIKIKAEVDQQINQFGKIKTLADRATSLRDKREEMRRAVDTVQDAGIRIFVNNLKNFTFN